MNQGKLISLYGVNNLGKTTQAHLLAERIKSGNLEAEIFKDPNYDLEPTGSLMNGYLRGGNPYNFSPREYQLLGVANKYHFKSELSKKLSDGINMIAEGYWGTSVAWGAANGVDRELLLKLHSGLIKEDLAFLFEGERFEASSEAGHPHENDEDLISRSVEEHRKLAEEFGWIRVNANKKIEEIHEFIWQEVSKIL